MEQIAHYPSHWNCKTDSFLYSHYYYCIKAPLDAVHTGLKLQSNGLLTTMYEIVPQVENLRRLQ
jgi:hypothetical protein